MKDRSGWYEDASHAATALHAQALGDEEGNWDEEEWGEDEEEEWEDDDDEDWEDDEEDDDWDEEEWEEDDEEDFMGKRRAPRRSWD